MSSEEAPLAAPSYSTAQLARRLGVSVPTVRKWVDLGILKAWKTVGGHRRIDARSAEAFLAAQQGDAGAALDGDTRPGALAAPAPRSSTPIVLIVDDDPNDRELLAAMVEMALPEARVTFASNGFQALVSIGQDPPDVLITDIMMPHMNGLEMVRYLSALDEELPRRIFAVSSHTRTEIARLGSLPEGVRFLQKPLEMSEVVQSLRAAVAA